MWQNKGVQNENHFAKVFKKRLIDCHAQNWHEHVYTSDRFNVYRQDVNLYIKSNFTSVMNKHICDVLITFRVGASQIRTHKLWYVQHEDLMCPLCNKCPEDEIHFLFHCEWLKLMIFNISTSHINTMFTILLWTLCYLCKMKTVIKI